MDKVMIIGAIGAGKSSLTKALLGKSTPIQKTQALTYEDWIVDTPGEYTENPLYYKAIMATSLEVGRIILIQDATKQRTIFPPGFAHGFLNKKPIGVVTKMDHTNADVERAISFLQKALPPGAMIVLTSALKGLGITELLRLLGKFTDGVNIDVGQE